MDKKVSQVEIVKELRKFNELLADYLDNVDMDEADKADRKKEDA